PLESLLRLVQPPGVEPDLGHVQDQAGSVFRVVLGEEVLVGRSEVWQRRDHPRTYGGRVLAVQLHRGPPAQRGSPRGMSVGQAGMSAGAVGSGRCAVSRSRTAEGGRVRQPAAASTIDRGWPCSRDASWSTTPRAGRSPVAAVMREARSCWASMASRRLTGTV